MTRNTLAPGVKIEVESLLTGPGIQAVLDGDRLRVSPAAFVRLAMGDDVAALVMPSLDLARLGDLIAEDLGGKKRAPT